MLRLLLILGFFLVAMLIARECIPKTPQGGHQKPIQRLQTVTAFNTKPRSKKPPVSLYWAEGKSLSARELRCLALNVYHEARGESRAGQIGVAQITVNRAESAFRNKTTICSVVYDTQQFSWTHSKRHLRPMGEAWEASLEVAKEVADGLRIRGLETSLFFHATSIRTPHWARHMVPLQAIGQHTYLAHNP